MDSCKNKSTTGVCQLDDFDELPKHQHVNPIKRDAKRSCIRISVVDFSKKNGSKAEQKVLHDFDSSLSVSTKSTDISTEDESSFSTSPLSELTKTPDQYDGKERNDLSSKDKNSILTVGLSKDDSTMLPTLSVLNEESNSPKSKNADEHMNEEDETPSLKSCSTMSTVPSPLSAQRLSFSVFPTPQKCVISITEEDIVELKNWPLQTPPICRTKNELRVRKLNEKRKSTGGELGICI